MYYPLSQITANLYTPGKEYEITSTGQEYKGYYWKSPSGKYFTGKTPQDTPILEITPIKIQLQDSELSNIIQIASFAGDPDSTTLYYNDSNRPERLENYNPEIPFGYIFAKNIDTDKVIFSPTYFPNIPTEKDYKIGEYRRYFCKKINEIVYVEIEKKYYDKLTKKDSTVAFEYYTPFNIPWKIIGDKKKVFNTNKNIVELAIKKSKLPKFNEYLKEDYLKYYR